MRQQLTEMSRFRPTGSTQIGPMKITEKIVIQFSQRFSSPQGAGPTSANLGSFNEKIQKAFYRGAVLGATNWDIEI